MNVSKYDFYDIVIVNSKKTKLLSINGKKGVIRGNSQSEEEPQKYAYAVDIHNKSNEFEDGWFIFEEDLRPTGMKADPHDYEITESIKIKVNPKTGKGEIVDDD
jgi:hypothetical protein